MTESTSSPGGDWVDGSLEAGADPTPAGKGTGSVPSPGEGEQGVGIGAGEPNSFEPEEDAG